MVEESYSPLSDADDSTLYELAKASGYPLLTKLSKPEKQRALDQVTEWLHFNDPDPRELDDPTLLALSTLPVTGSTFTPPEKKDIDDNSLSWVCCNDFKPSKPKPVDDPSLEKHANIPMAPGMKPLQKKNLKNNITDWLRGNN